MLLLYGNRYLVSEDAVIDYLISNDVVKRDNVPVDMTLIDKGVFIRSVVDQHNVYAGDIIKEISSKIDTREIKKLSVSEKIAFAEKYKLFFEYKSVCLTPAEYTQSYYTEGMQSYAFDLVDISEKVYRLKREKDMLEMKINKLKAQQASIQPTELNSPKTEVRHIHPEFNFSDFSSRFRYINGNDVDSEVFWEGTDRSVGYSDEVYYMVKAIDAEQIGDSTITADVYVRQEVCTYQFLVSELLSVNRIKIFETDYDNLRQRLRGYFDSQLKSNENFRKLYDYIKSRNNVVLSVTHDHALRRAFYAYTQYKSYGHTLEESQLVRLRDINYVSTEYPEELVLWCKLYDMSHPSEIELTYGYISSLVNIFKESVLGDEITNLIYSDSIHSNIDSILRWYANTRTNSSSIAELHARLSAALLHTQLGHAIADAVTHALCLVNDIKPVILHAIDKNQYSVAVTDYEDTGCMIYVNVLFDNIQILYESEYNKFCSQY